VTEPAGDRPWDVEGPEGAPAIVFVHGAILTRTTWHPQVDRLRDRYRCVSLDLPGHGRRIDEPFTFEGAVDRIGEALVEAAGGRAVLVGLSLGGWLAMAAAARWPDRVRGLVVADASREPRGAMRAAMTAYAAALRLYPERLIQAIGRRLLRGIYDPTTARRLLAGGYHPRSGSTGIRGVRGLRFRDRLLAYGGPILVINGALDVIFTRGERSLLEGVPNVTRRRLRGAGHLSNVDRPDEFTAALVTFEESLPV